MIIAAHHLEKIEDDYKFSINVMEVDLAGK
jgi:hypothetical protein